MRIDAIPIGNSPPDDINVIIEVEIGGEPIKYEMNKEAGTLLESQFKTARDVLKFPDKMEPWKGKVTVYLFAERSQYTSFVRRVEKRKLESGEVASHVGTDDKLQVAASPSSNKWEWPAEAQAAAYHELSRDSLEDRFAQIEHGSNVDDELAALKKQKQLGDGH